MSTQNRVSYYIDIPTEKFTISLPVSCSNFIMTYNTFQLWIIINLILIGCSALIVITVEGIYVF